jgi:hypothetical protein
MTDNRYIKEHQRQEEDGKDKNRERILLTPPAKKLRMSRRKVEH